MDKVGIRSKKDALKLYCEEMGKMKKKLVLVGIVFMFVSFFLFAISLASENVKAESAAGTWTGSAVDSTDAADYYYSVTLTLSGGSSVSGTMELTCTGVNEKMAGWVDPSIINSVTRATVQGTMEGSSLTLHVTDEYGCTFTFTMTVSGGKMSGGGHYTGGAGETDSWTFDLTGGGGGGFSASIGAPAAAIAFVGGAVGLAAASPHIVRGAVQKTQSSYYPQGKPTTPRPDRHTPFSATGRTRPRSDPRIPFNARHPQQSPIPQPPPSENPFQTLTMPLQPPNTTVGAHQVPWDAPNQCPANRNPNGYPYGRGTSATMRCPYCGLNTLSPFTTGWFCTNPHCIARREYLQRGYTTERYNNMTWRRLQP